jgi:hypothetical protein
MERLELGQFIRISNFDAPLAKSRIYRIDAREPFIHRSTTGTSNDFPSTVANNANSDWKQIKLLEPSKRTPKTIYHVAWGVQNGMAYRAKLPSAVERFGLDDSPETGYITNLESDHLDPDPQFAFWTQEGIIPNFNAYHNNTLTGQLSSGLGTVYPRIMFKGYRYQLETLKNEQRQGLTLKEVKTIIMGGVRS